MGSASGVWRVFHWGPMVALVIIKWITFITLYCNIMLWPPAESLYGLVFTAIFLGMYSPPCLRKSLNLSSGFSSLTLFHFFCSLSTGPGFLPAGWSPVAQAEAGSPGARTETGISQVQWCNACQGYKAPRSHHCRKCGRCVMKMDHHCPWINTCVGHHNHGHFIAFLASAVCGCSMASFSLALSLYYGLNRLVWLSLDAFLSTSFSVVKLYLRYYFFLYKIVSCTEKQRKITKKKK